MTGIEWFAGAYGGARRDIVRDAEQRLHGVQLADHLMEVAA